MVPAIRLAQQRDVGDKGFAVETEAAPPQPRPQLFHQHSQLCRCHIRARPGNPVVRPEPQLPEAQGESLGLNAAGKLAQFIQPGQFGLAQERQGQMDGLSARALAAAQLLQLLAGMIELGNRLGIGPQRKEQPDAFGFGLFDDFTPKFYFNKSFINSPVALTPFFVNNVVMINPVIVYARPTRSRL